MDSLLLQDWVTIAGGGNNAVVAQGSTGYLDVSEYHDLVFYLDAKNLVNPTVISYETAPSAEDSAFVSMLQIQTPGGVNAVTRTDAILGSYALVPPSKYVRWACYGSGYNCTFRVWIAGVRLP